MKVILFDSGSYTYKDVLENLVWMGYECKTVYYHFADRFQDDFFCERFKKILEKECCEFVFSINFYPLVAEKCFEKGIKYIAWCYDSPLAQELEKYFYYNTNHIFLFDRMEADEYLQRGFTRVFYQPLAVNTKRLEETIRAGKDEENRRRYGCDISFVGRLYDSPLDILLSQADDYVKGYIEGIIQSQLRIYGYYFIDSVIPDELLNRVNFSLGMADKEDLRLNRRGLSYAIAAQITNIERCFLLEQLNEKFELHLYTNECKGLDEKVKNRGMVKYYSEMPFAFYYSKLSLNPTLRSIRSGIPQRALDIIGSRGVLFSNYQPELAEYFEDGKDCIIYGSMEEAFEKAIYYLENDEERQKIALNGYEKVKREFEYKKQITNIIEIVYGRIIK
jgi:putative uncharacterized protein, CGEB-like protein